MLQKHSKRLFSALTPAHKNITFAASTLKQKVMPKEKVNYQEVYDLYLQCSETKDLKEFCSEYDVNYALRLKDYMKRYK